MSLVLNIDTALDTASVCLAEKGMLLQQATSDNQKDHAGWLHTSIRQLLQKNNTGTKDLQAVAVSIGPGSYTGLRVGLAAAKGICFALEIPLITINNLKLLAFAVKDEAADLICPMIDARRMEVYTALYDKELQEKNAPHALVIDEKSVVPFLESGHILFCGNGAAKLKSFLPGYPALFSDTMANATHLARLSYTSYENKEFADMAYAEPLYLKEFHTVNPGINKK